MKTSISITAAIVAVASPLAIVPSAMAQQKPNIVFMMVDNLGWGEIGVYGGGILRGAETLRLDALAAEGMRLPELQCRAAAHAEPLGADDRVTSTP